MLLHSCNKRMTIFVLLFFILSFASIGFFLHDKDKSIDKFLDDKTVQYLQKYDVVYTKYKELASIIYETRVDTPDVRLLLSELYLSNDEETKKTVRKYLYKDLLPTYELLKQHNIKQFHFHLPNNESFLRFHRPQKFGDNLTNIRSTVKYVNETKKPIDGFEEGRIYNGYRFVFPLFLENLYLGSVEVSYNTLAMNSEFMKNFNVVSNFLISKDVVDEKVFKDERSNYIPSLYEGFLVEKRLYDYLLTKEDYDGSTKLLESTYDKFKRSVNQKQSFSVFDTTRDRVLTYIMVENPITKKLAGVFIIESDATYIFNKINNFYFLVSSSIITIFISLLFLYRLINSKCILDEQIEIRTKELEENINLLNQYKDIVDHSSIVSKTDIEGIITYVNDRFCEKTGYSRQELIGQPHNIIRHPDMPSSAFKDLWDTILAKKLWIGEVKSKKKNGEYYVARSFILPILNNDGDIEEFIAVRHDITDIYNLQHEIELTQKEIIFTMGSICETRSKETGNHVRRVAEYSKILAKYVGLDQKRCDLIACASPMHDIGKVAIEDEILHKPDSLTNEEFEKMRQHTEIGYNMLAHSRRPLVKTAAIIALEHHERWDGQGYPRHLKGEEISIEGRITSLADTFDALGSQRVYKKAWDDQDIFEYFKEQRGKQFDPDLVDIFFENLEEFLEVRDKFKDL